MLKNVKKTPKQIPRQIPPNLPKKKVKHQPFQKSVTKKGRIIHNGNK
jgi:hypothetical protein